MRFAFHCLIELFYVKSFTIAYRYIYVRKNVIYSIYYNLESDNGSKTRAGSRTDIPHPALHIINILFKTKKMNMKKKKSLQERNTTYFWVILEQYKKLKQKLFVYNIRAEVAKTLREYRQQKQQHRQQQ